MPAKREAFNWRSIPSMKSYSQIPKRIVRDILELLYCHRKAISGRKMLFNWRFWWLTLWLIISYALWYDEIKLCILSPCLMLYFKHFLYWLKDLEFPCNKLYPFSLNFLYLNIYIFVKGWCIIEYHSRAQFTCLVWFCVNYNYICFIIYNNRLLMGPLHVSIDLMRVLIHYHHAVLQKSVLVDNWRLLFN